jgi:hypothetical protein
MQFDVRAAIHFLHLRQKTDKEIDDKLVIACGPAVPRARTMRNWVRAFEAGRTELNDLPRSGRRRDLDKVKRIKELLDGNPDGSQEQICRILDLHHDAIKRVITEDLGLRKLNYKWLPHRLNSSQKADRVRASPVLLAFVGRLRSVNWLLHRRRNLNLV